MTNTCTRDCREVSRAAECLPWLIWWSQQGAACIAHCTGVMGSSRWHSLNYAPIFTKCKTHFWQFAMTTNVLFFLLYIFITKIKVQLPKAQCLFRWSLCSICYLGIIYVLLLSLPQSSNSSFHIPAPAMVFFWSFPLVSSKFNNLPIYLCFCRLHFWILHHLFSDSATVVVRISCLELLLCMDKLLYQYLQCCKWVEEQVCNLSCRRRRGKETR